MLQLELEGRFGHQARLGPLPLMCLDGQQLKLARSEVVGTLVENGWCFDDRLMTRVEVKGPLRVRFEDEESCAEFGPYPSLLLVGTYLFAGGTLLAFHSLDDGQWYLLSVEEAWPRVVIQSAVNERKTLGGHSSELHQRIAVAAYFRAEARNFAPGRELEDWLAAEVEITSRVIKLPKAHRRMH